MSQTLIEQALSALNNKLDKTGGTITNDLKVNRNLNVAGTLTASHVVTKSGNDLAEYFPTNTDDIDFGEIVMLDINNPLECYIKAVKGQGPVIGVKTEIWSVVLGGEPDSIPPGYKFVAISLAGRIPVKVKGKVELGDYIGLSDIPGVGCVSEEDIVGIALETYDSEEIGTIKIKVI